MDIIGLVAGSVGGFVVENIASIAVGGVGAVAAPVLFSWAWDYFKPIAGFVDFMSARMFRLGVAVGSFMKRRESAYKRAQIYKELKEAGPDLWDRFMAGVKSGAGI